MTHSLVIERLSQRLLDETTVRMCYRYVSSTDAEARSIVMAYAQDMWMDVVREEDAVWYGFDDCLCDHRHEAFSKLLHYFFRMTPAAFGQMQTAG